MLSTPGQKFTIVFAVSIPIIVQVSMDLREL